MNIVLYQPEIPQNTGNIARTCAATNTTLHLIEPLGFSLDDKHLKRAGLDYWHLLDIRRYPDFASFLKENSDGSCYYCTTKASRIYTDASYAANDYLIFGPETRGLPESMLQNVYGDSIRIPMEEEARSLNLSKAVAVVLYEALRQTGFSGLKKHGQLSSVR